MNQRKNVETMKQRNKGIEKSKKKNLKNNNK